ncbi:MAG: PD40 domain-containing protein [Anaerolineae bacterium]|nr:PD40 domain-containing protein [Anaerolineae bacterium]
MTGARRAAVFVLSVAVLWLFALLPARAQSTPLGAPLIAAASAQLDRIVLYDLSGGRRELRFDTREHMVWDFTPDGCRIVFTLDEPGGVSRIYSARLDGSDLRPLVQFADLPTQDWSEWEPVVNPIDGRIAFTLFRRETPPGSPVEETYHIAWIPAEGGAPQFYSVSGDEHSPVWSHDGAWLAYVAYDGRIPGPDIFSTVPPTETSGATPVPKEQLLNEADLWVVSVDGGTKYRLTAFPTGSVNRPVWSPDDLLIEFFYSPRANNDTVWMIGNADAAIPTQLNFEWMLGLDATWLPDGNAILATMRDFQGITENRLWQVPLVGNADTEAVQYPLDSALRFIDYPRFSADGRFLALRSEYHLAVIDTTTGGWAWLDDSNPGNTPPAWSPAAYTGETACTE